MNNRIQQRFDRSIRDAVAASRQAVDLKPRRDLTTIIRTIPDERRTSNGRLYLDPITGATVWDPQARLQRGEP